MVKRSASQLGYTLMEMMIVVGVLGVIFSLGPNLFKQVRRFFFLNTVKTEIQREARSIMVIVTQQVRMAQSQTIVIDQVAGQPYYSRLSFQDINGKYIRYYQTGKNFYMVDTGTHTLTGNLRYVAFAVPRSDDLGIVSVSFTLEKSIYEGQTKAIHMASQQVRIMN